MAPIKFEENLRDKLEERSLQPSANSWSKLSDRLDKEEKSGRKPWIGWLSIAAGLIIFLAIAIQVFGSKTTDDAKPELVIEDVKEQQIDEKQPQFEEVNTIDLALEEEILEVQENEKNPVDEAKINNYKSIVKNSSKSDSQLANTSTKDNSKLENDQNEAHKSEILITEAQVNTQAVAEALDAINTENTVVTDKEVDSLLKVASKELFRDQLKKETTKTVDAKSLLEDVEEEMGQSFRSKVFEALKGSYETVKTAVAERNN
jgi:hypothetical protein